MPDVGCSSVPLTTTEITQDIIAEVHISNKSVRRSRLELYVSSTIIIHPMCVHPLHTEEMCSGLIHHQESAFSQWLLRVHDVAIIGSGSLATDPCTEIPSKNLLGMDFGGSNECQATNVNTKFFHYLACR
jgi:hypothetical protein